MAIQFLTYDGLPVFRVGNTTQGLTAFGDFVSGLPELSTLAIGAGSFVLTGQAVGLAAQRKLAVGAASFTFTGQSVGLAAGKKLGIGASSFVLTGNAVALTAQRKLAIGTGTFSLSGQDVAFAHGAANSLAAGVGAFSLTGNAVGLAAQRKLGVSAGSFSLTGQSVSFAHGLTMPVGAGVFLLSGQDVGLVTPNTLHADAGAFILSGQAVDLVSSATPPVVIQPPGRVRSKQRAFTQTARLRAFDVGDEFGTLRAYLGTPEAIAAAIRAFVEQEVPPALAARSVYLAKLRSKARRDADIVIKAHRGLPSKELLVAFMTEFYRRPL